MTPSELNAFLKRNKMTANELSAKLGVHWTTISRWRNGHEHIPRAVELACKWLEMEGGAALQSPEVQAWKRDSERLDWLADPKNSIGNVQLPTVCVERNPHSLRDAIDDAMEQQP